MRCELLFQLVLQIYVSAMNLVSFLAFHLCIYRQKMASHSMATAFSKVLWFVNFDANALPQKQPKKITFEDSLFKIHALAVNLPVCLCHFWIAKGWLFVDSSMDAGILKPLPECLAKTFFSEATIGLFGRSYWFGRMNFGKHGLIWQLHLNPLFLHN